MALLAVVQVLVSAGCVAASFTTWMARGPSGGPPSSTLAALWPRATAGLLVLLVASPALLGFGPTS
jgi:hypothetical protein